MLRKIILIGSVVWAFTVTARVVPVIITWQDDPRTTATISWERDSEGRGMVRYGITTNYSQTASDWGGTRRHSIKLDGLEPGTIYHYEASSTDGFLKDDRTFRTAPPSTGAVHFAVHGDLQGGLSSEWARTVSEAIIADNPDLVIHIGDMSIEDGIEGFESWQDFFDVATDELERAVFMPVPGNHDNGPDGNANYWQVFHLPERPANGSCYSYDAGNIHFVALNSDFEVERQTNWLARDLQAAAFDTNTTWIIPYFHHPPHSRGERQGEPAVSNAWCKVFTMYEADIAFSGHSHNYQRTVLRQGVTYMVAGGGGGRLYTSAYTPGFHEYATTCYHFVSCHVTGSLMNLRGIRSDGQVFDSVVYTNVGRAVHVSPAFPRRGEVCRIGYDPSQGPLAASSPIYIHLGIDDFTGALVSSQMTYNAGTGRWEYDYVVPAAASNRLAFVFRDAAAVIWDNNYTYNWQALLERVTFSPDPPAAGSNLTFRYAADMGPLTGYPQLYAMIGFDGWDVAADAYLTMTNIGGQLWEYTYPVPAWAGEVDLIFGAGSARDNNDGMDWRVAVSGALADPSIDPPAVVVAGTPAVSSNPPTIQNNIGDNFDLVMSGGKSESTHDEYGFGSFGDIYFNHDSSNLYVGGIEASLGGSNNVLVLFLGLDTLSDNATNLWHKDGLPQALDFMHNVGFTEPMDIAIVFGDEFGDDPDYTNFTYGGYDFGQGVYYIGTGNSTFDIVAGARLSQFDGEGTTACVTDDDDTNRLVDRWEASLPWSSLTAPGGVGDVEWILVAGVIGSSSTNGKDRYLSATYLGDGTCGARHSYVNFGYSFLTVEPVQILLEHGDCDNDGLPNGWEHVNFGTAEGPGADEDTDGDRCDNWGEYVADTQPTNDGSFFGGNFGGRAAGQIVLTWPGASNRVYTVHSATNLTGDFLPLAVDLTVNIYTDQTTAAGQRFYRIGVDYP